MYNYIFRSLSNTTSSTVNRFLPFFSIKPGAKPIAIVDIAFDPNVQLYILAIRRGCAFTTGTTTSPVALTLDAPTPLFAAVYSASGALTATNGYTDKEVYHATGGVTGQPEWRESMSGLILPANYQGSLDVYVTSPTASSSFKMNVIVVE